MAKPTRTKTATKRRVKAAARPQRTTSLRGKRTKSERPRAAASAKKPRVSHVPAGFHAVKAGFTVVDCAGAIEFLKTVFGAKVTDFYGGPDGRPMHAELRIGDTELMCGEAANGESARPMLAMIYVRDCDTTFARSIAAGATEKRALEDQFYGDRSGRVVDRFGNEWVIATHIEDVTRREMQRRFKAMFAGPPTGAPAAASGDEPATA